MLRIVDDRDRLALEAEEHLLAIHVMQRARPPRGKLDPPEAQLRRSARWRGGASESVTARP
jgi:hypothetical protein